MNSPVDNKVSKKEEILEKSRKSKHDEGWEHAERRGNKIGVIVYAIVAFILIIFSVPHQMNVVNIIAALSFAWVIGGAFSYYRFTKKRIYLIGSCCAAITTIYYALMVIFPTMH